MYTIISDRGADENDPHRTIFKWRFVQSVALFAGLAIFFCLIFYPSWGILLFWNILIPVAPLLLVVEAGIWRNICPLATLHLLPRHLNLSKRRKMTLQQQGKLQLIAVLALYVIVPLRHPLFDSNAMATGALLFCAAVVGMGMGFVYDWKSGWCSSLCPVHPVEKLYGGNILKPLPNAHCDKCVKCTVPCPDSTPNINPGTGQKTVYHKLSAVLTVGGFPGFIWGWFQVQDHVSPIGWSVIVDAYKLPLIGMGFTLLLFLLLEKLIEKRHMGVLIKCFAAAGVSCYYWFKLPALLGDLGVYLFKDMNGLLPDWGMTLAVILSTCFFFWWLVVRRSNNKSWVIRPAFSSKRDQ